MNWYKTAKTIMDYFDIGHDTGNKNDLLWFYDRGIMKVSPANDRIHNDVWHTMSDFDYRGRFEPETKLLSIINPFEGKPIPNPILQSLYSRFGNNIKIMEFN